MDDQDFYYIDFNKNSELKLVVEGENGKTNNFDLIEFSANFALNAIPDCTCLVATGRSANFDKQIAEIHNFTNKNRHLLPAKVILRTHNKKITLFDGYLSSISPHRSNNKFSVTVHLVHWLKDLDSFNLITNLTHMSHPFDLGSLQFTGKDLGPSLAFSVSEGLLKSKYLEEAATKSKINDGKFLDLWNFIRNFLLIIADQASQLYFNCSDEEGNLYLNIEESKNAKMIGALKRLGSDKSLKIYDREIKLYKNIKLKNENLNELVTEGIKIFTLAQNVSNLSINTVWAKLVGELFPILFLNLIPTCSEATVSVILPYYKPDKNNLMVLGTESYYSIQTVSSYHNPLKGVLVIPPGQHVLTFVGNGLQPGENNEQQNRGVYDNFICYINDNMENNENGSFIIIKAPPIIDIVRMRFYSSEVIRFIREYAKQFYFTEALKEHSATVSLPFRYDIAPGSLVVIRGAGEKFITNDTIVNDIVGLVVKVSLNINASEAIANTNIMLSYVHEVKDDSFHLDEHPLFDSESIPNGKGENGGYAHWLPLASEEKNQ